MKRREFFKFLGKGAAIAGVVGLFGLPEIIENEPELEDIWCDIVDDENYNIYVNPDTFDAWHYKNCVRNHIFCGQFSTINIEAKALSDDEIDKIYKDAKRLFFASKFPELAPLWKNNVGRI